MSGNHCKTRTGYKKGLRFRNSPICTLSQNGYGDLLLGCTVAVFQYVQAYTHLHMRVYTYMYRNKHHKHTYIHTYSDTYTHAYTHTCIHAHIFTYACTHMCIYTQAHISFLKNTSIQYTTRKQPYARTQFSTHARHNLAPSAMVLACAQKSSTFDFISGG